MVGRRIAAQLARRFGAVGGETPPLVRL